jgi:hypothetical protein
VLALGFEARWRAPSFLMAEFRGCPRVLAIDNPPANGTIEVGYSPWPAPRELSVRSFPIPAERPSGPLEIPLRHTVCGDISLRPVWRSGAEPDKAARCEGSTLDGRIILPAKAGAEVHCRLLVAEQ